MAAGDKSDPCWNNKERRPKTEEEEKAVASFRDFLRIKTISSFGPSGAYREAAEFLKALLLENGLENVHDVEMVKNKPVVVATWSGSQPELPTILMNGHYDVVPVVLESWDCDPFEAKYEEDTGRIYGRGTQDMKCVCIQYVLAIGKLIKAGVKPLRTFHLTFVPDEEIGGKEGFSDFLESDHFKKLNIGVALDEGLANTGDCFTVFHGERTGRWIYVDAEGPTGHGSRFIQDTAVSKLLKFCNAALDYRQQQEAQLGYEGDGCAHAQAKKLGDVTTVNLTMLEAGVSLDGGKTFSLNVIPHKARAGFDIRMSPHVPMEEFLVLLDQWAKEAGEGVSWQDTPGTKHLNKHCITSIEGDDCEWWDIVRGGIVEAGGKPVIPEIFPAATDSRFLREKGFPAFGFSPMCNTPILLHEHNEYIDVGVFLEGIEIFEKFIGTLAHVDKLPRE